MSNYNKFLEKKLFLIETLSLKGWLRAEDETLKKIHSICLAPPSEIQKYLEEKSNEGTS